MTLGALLGGGAGPPHDIVRTSRGGVPSALSLAGGVPSDLQHLLVDLQLNPFPPVVLK